MRRGIGKEPTLQPTESEMKLLECLCNDALWATEAPYDHTVSCKLVCSVTKVKQDMEMLERLGLARKAITREGYVLLYPTLQGRAWVKKSP